MSPIERWWRVVPRTGQPSVWLQQEPAPDMLSAAWEGSKVEGPFVPVPDEAAIERGANELVRLAHSMTHEQMIAAFEMGDRYVAKAVLRAALGDGDGS
jgi:hypothetical protein